MNADERAIRELIEQWHRKTAAGDVEGVLRLMSEDVVFLVSGKAPIRGRSEFEAGLRTLLKSHRVDSTGDVREIVVSERLAYSWTDLTVSITPLAGGSSVTRSGTTLSILRKALDGSWLLVRDANLLPPP